MTYGRRLTTVTGKYGHLCVGVDPHPALLEQWGLPQSIVGLAQFGLQVLDSAAGRVAAIKPQVALYEAYGSRGFAVLEDLLARAAKHDLLVIADAKRGDIGSTNAGYARAWLEQTSPFIADALTLSPYLGVESLDALVETATANDKGVYVLAATSNPEATITQRAVTSEGLSIAATAIQYAASHVPDSQVGDVGVVVGATVDPTVLADAWQLPGASSVPILAPGFGAQGAQLGDFTRLYGDRAAHTLANVSRSVLRAGPLGLTDAIDAANAQLV